MNTPRTLSIRLYVLFLAVLFGGAGISPAQVTQMLHSTPPTPARDNYSGVLGCQFQVGSSNVVVSHLGFFDINGDGLAFDHNVGLFSSSLTSPSILGQVVVPAGTSAYFTNGFRWIALDPPLLLLSNTTYLVAGVVSNADGDTWQDAFTPTWNAFYTGSTATTTRHSLFGPGYGGGATIVWPPPSLSQNGNNNTYGNVSLAYIEVDQARVGVAQTNVSLSAGQTLSVNGFATGQQPITYQWYSAPNTPIPDQTNATLLILNTATTNSGTYFLTASNALGGEQSSNVTVSVTSFPVGITKQPTNLTVFANYPATFSITATGSPPIFYQWFRDGVAITNATNNSFSIASASITNDGDVYSSVVSNFTSATPYTQTSDNATLTVIPNSALPQQILHGVNTNLTQNSFSGLIGGHITVGSSSITVTHLGYYAPTNQFTDSTHCNLTQSHRVGIFSANGSVLLGFATVPAGVSPVINGYLWAPLSPPLVLTNNTQYLLLAETFSGVDPWGNTYAIPDLNHYFASACDAVFWGNPWPNAGVSGSFSGQMYSAPNLAILAPSTPSAFVAPTNVTQYAGLNVVLTATAVGQAPLTLQWYKESSGLLTDQTNVTLNLNNLGLGDSGNYYVIASNTVTTAFARSDDAVVNVLPDTGPIIDQDVQSQDVLLYQNVLFSAGVSGTPPLLYQWTFNGNPISGATNSSLTVKNVSAASAGNYQLLITNNYDSATSSVAVLTVENPPAGYASAAMGPTLLAYYRFSDASSGLGIATNFGALGFAYNGTYEGTYSGVAGPTGLSNFEPGNLAVSLSGFDADVLVPSLGNVTVTNCTIAAWVYDGGGQLNDTAIFYHRAASIFGLSLGLTNGAEWLKYTWNGASFNNYTGLILPTNQWAFVAMSITPSNATIYLQNGTGMSSTNFAGTYPPASLSGISYVGWDSAGGNSGRRWAGAIDEVMVFGEALSPAAINALYSGVSAPLTLSIGQTGTNIVVIWPRGTLLESPGLTGPWTTNSATSPYTTPPIGAMKFYRVLEQ